MSAVSALVQPRASTPVRVAAVLLLLTYIAVGAGVTTVLADVNQQAPLIGGGDYAVYALLNHPGSLPFGHVAIVVNDSFWAVGILLFAWLLSIIATAIVAQDEERCRLERNLHDGAQQNLVALKVKLGLAETFVERDPVRAKQTLAELKVDTEEALETLRDLARGIYPPLLADKGLAAALGAQARKATLPVEVQTDGLGRYPQDFEAAAYFCVLEALQNVQKYAAATTLTVRLRAEDGELRFEVEDDGAGFHAARANKGSGLTNMEDRLDALGGGVVVDSAPGQGTQLRGSVPVLVGVTSP